MVSLRSQRPDTEPGDAFRIGMARPGGGYTIVAMPFETYVARVLDGEAARGSDPAVLEALAIAIRTYAVGNRGRHRAEGFDLCDQTHCQVVRNLTQATERAATATAGRVLMHHGLIATVFYSASCGGRTEIPSAVWPGAEDPPYLPSRRDDACEGTPEWSAEIEADDLVRALRAAGYSGERLRGMRVAAHDVSGRVAKLRLDGFTPNEISGQDLRTVVGRTLGWQHVKSAAFDLERRGDVYRFNGHGSGHGVGMCVIGATNLAARGQSAAQILRRYFPGTDIVSMDAGPVVARAEPTAPPRPATTTPAPRSPVAIDLPAQDERERSAVTDLVLRARADVASLLGVPPPARLTLRFHPTIASYERLTGQPWFTSSEAVNGDLHFIPIAVLRDRGVFDLALRRELVRVMTMPVLAQRPAWVREGAAMYFARARSDAGHHAIASPVRSPCPRDVDLLQPVSPGALSTALGEALACFERQLTSGKSWRDVR